jgi:hypothetical protein
MLEWGWMALVNGGFRIVRLEWQKTLVSVGFFSLEAGAARRKEAELNGNTQRCLIIAAS